MAIDFKDLRVSANFPSYPPYHTGPYLEEYFYSFYIKNKNLFDDTGVTLIPIFWTNIYNTGQNKNLIQTYLNALPNNKRYFTVSQHDDAVREQLPNNTIQFSAGGLSGQIPIPLVCSSIPKDIISTTVTKDILCSFVGTVSENCNIRKDLYNQLQNNKEFYFSNKQAWSPIIPDNKFKEFINVTQRSWFTLCPRGYGLQSFRLYETLQLGSIPIIIYDTEWLPFKDIIDWSTFSILVHSSDIHNIPNIINKFTKEEKLLLIKNGYNIYKKYFTLDSVCNQILLFLQENKNTKTLSETMAFFNSDKSSKHHNYTNLYCRLFHNIKNNSLNIFELGLGTNNPDIPSSMGVNGTPGASLRGWREYFKNSKIYGADVDKNILFTEDNIKTFYVDQTNPKTIFELWNNNELKDIEFDIIIDDGLHEVDANICFLKNSFYKLKQDGIYIIEDITNSSYNQFVDVLEQLKNELNLTYEIKKIYNQYNTWDNTIALLYKK